MHQLIQVDVEDRAPTAELWYIQNHTKELVDVPRADVEYFILVCFSLSEYNLACVHAMTRI